MRKKLTLFLMLIVTMFTFAELSYNSIDDYNLLKLDANMGKIIGTRTVDKFGVNLNIETGTAPEDVWEFGGKYTFDKFGTTAGLYISSSDVDDAGKELVVEGLDIDGNLTIQTITLTGQANVELPTPLWRTFRMFNVSEVGNDFEGVIYCHNDPAPINGVPGVANVRAIITGSNNQTLMSIYCIPAGYVGLLFRGELGIELEGNVSSLLEYASVHYESARFNQVFTVKKYITLMVSGGSALYQDTRSFSDVLPALTDIKLTVEHVTQDMGVWGTFDILLVKENQFSDSYLRSIEQPGY